MPTVKDPIDISAVTTQGPNIGAHRSTKYELRFLHVGPNSVGVECTERGVYGISPARCEVPQDLYTDEQVALIKEAFSLIEEGFRLVHEEKEAELGLVGIDVPRAAVHELVRQAEEAKVQAATARLEAARLEAETIAKRAEAEELDANLAVMRTEAEAVRQAAQLEADAKRAAEAAGVPFLGALEAEPHREG